MSRLELMNGAVACARGGGFVIALAVNSPDLPREEEDGIRVCSNKRAHDETWCTKLDSIFVTDEVGSIPASITQSLRRKAARLLHTSLTERAHREEVL